MKAKPQINSPKGCSVPFCRSSSTKRKSKPSSSKPMGTNQFEKHNKKFGKLK